MEQSQKLVSELVEDFKANEHAYLSPSYQESQVRQDFIDKFFIALGWDVTHTFQKNPYQQEVKIEDKVVVGAAQKRADYSFAVSPNYEQVKFFVEAKKPARNLTNVDDYFQTIRYAWNSKTPISVLTDFEEFHILDCRYKPHPKDILERKIASYHYSDYTKEEIFAKIYHLFSRESVLAGSLDLFASTLKKKALKESGNLQPVDDAFLEELDEYRVILAKAFKKTNEQLQGEELTEAVQRTIDRLVFIRFLEDKGIEDRHIIGLHKAASVWQGFSLLCKRLEPKYNGLVFKPHRILDSGEFNPPDDKAFGGICESISDPSSPYDFNQIPISILGSIYERFLGKVVHATDKRVKIEEKPEVKKAGGVFYTPEYIVRYIVKETVSKLIEGKTPKEISKMAFADIACGSGSFLIEVYNQILEYHVRYYSEHLEDATDDDIFYRDGMLRLALKKKKEILLNNIYGVDIDYQATEVTQMSLYLKMLEHATMQDAHQFGMFKERILPDLRKNIICGNSLIARDITEGQLFEDQDVRNLNPLNYEDEFPQIMKRGGFDAIIGNPPYRVLGKADISPGTATYLSRKYACFQYKADLYHLFIERALGLSRINGVMGYITPNTWYTLPFTQRLRSFVLKNSYLSLLVNFNHQVFADANVDTVITIAKRKSENSKVDDDEVRVINMPKEFTPALLDAPKSQIKKQSDWMANKSFSFEIRTTKEEETLLNKIWQHSKPLGFVARASLGTQAYNSSKHTKSQIANRVFHSNEKLSEEYLKELGGSDVGRYTLQWKKKEWIKYGPWLHDYRTMEWLEGPRILIREITGKGKYKICGTFVEETYCNYKTILNLINGVDSRYSMKYFLGLLNSQFLSWVYPKISNKAVKDAFPRLSVADLRKLPIRTIDFENSSELSTHDHIVKLVDEMLAAREKLAIAKIEAETNRLERLCDALDRQIDEAVYTLYELTEEDIKLIELAQ